jgi:hypothetical protein
MRNHYPKALACCGLSVQNLCILAFCISSFFDTFGPRILWETYKTFVRVSFHGRTSHITHPEPKFSTRLAIATSICILYPGGKLTSSVSLLFRRCRVMTPQLRNSSMEITSSAGCSSVLGDRIKTEKLSEGSYNWLLFFSSRHLKVGTSVAPLVTVTPIFVPWQEPALPPFPRTYEDCSSQLRRAI